MRIRFYANGEIGIGYRAKVLFFNDAANNETSVTNELAKVLTNCGGMVDTLGGAITMMDMIKGNVTENSQYDCIWLIRPSNNYMPYNSHLSLRVDAFQNFGK